MSASGRPERSEIFVVLGGGEAVFVAVGLCAVATRSDGCAEDLRQLAGRRRA